MNILKRASRGGDFKWTEEDFPQAVWSGNKRSVNSITETGAEDGISLLSGIKKAMRAVLVGHGSGWTVPDVASNA